MVDTDILDAKLFNDLFIYYIKQNIGKLNCGICLMYVSILKSASTLCVQDTFQHIFFTFWQTLSVTSKSLGLVTFPSVTKSFFNFLMQTMFSFIRVNSSLFMKYSVVADVESVHWPNIIFNSLLKTFKDDCRNVHRAHLSSNNCGNTVESNKYSSSSTDVLTWLRVLSLFSWMVSKSVENEVVCVRE